MHMLTHGSGYPFIRGCAVYSLQKESRQQQSMPTHTHAHTYAHSLLPVLQALCTASMRRDTCGRPGTWVPCPWRQRTRACWETTTLPPPPTTTPPRCTATRCTGAASSFASERGGALTLQGWLAPVRQYYLAVHPDPCRPTLPPFLLSCPGHPPFPPLPPPPLSSFFPA